MILFITIAAGGRLADPQRGLGRAEAGPHVRDRGGACAGGGRGGVRQEREPRWSCVQLRHDCARRPAAADQWGVPGGLGRGADQAADSWAGGVDAHAELRSAGQPGAGEQCCSKQIFILFIRNIVLLFIRNIVFRIKYQLATMGLLSVAEAWLFRIRAGQARLRRDARARCRRRVSPPAKDAQILLSARKVGKI